MLLTILPTIACLLLATEAYRQCTGPDSVFDGYTYILDPASPGERVWSHCAFYNPNNDHAQCGRPTRPGQKYYLCDPDNLLAANSSREVIEHQLTETLTKTGTVCFDANGQRVRVVTAVAVFDRIRIPDLHNPDLCINECGQLVPWSNLSGWYPSEAEQYQILQNFADGLRAVWRLGQCENDVILVYCREFNKLQLSYGNGASKYISSDQITNLRKSFQQFVQGTINSNQTHVGLTQGLIHIIKSLQQTLKSVKIAVILISTVLTFAGGILVWFLIYAGRHYYDVKVLQHWLLAYPWKVLSWLLQVLSGILVVRQLILVQMRMSGKGMGFGLGALGVFLLGWVLLYFVGPGSLSQTA